MRNFDLKNVACRFATWNFSSSTTIRTFKPFVAIISGYLRNSQFQHFGEQSESHAIQIVTAVKQARTLVMPPSSANRTFPELSTTKHEHRHFIGGHPHLQRYASDSLSSSKTTHVHSRRPGTERPANICFGADRELSAASFRLETAV